MILTLLQLLESSVETHMSLNAVATLNHISSLNFIQPSSAQLLV